jgi:hypothetical protein
MMAVVDEQYFLMTAIVDEQYFLTTAVINERYFLMMAVIIEQYFLTIAVVDKLYLKRDNNKHNHNRSYIPQQKCYWLLCLSKVLEPPTKQILPSPGQYLQGSP